MILDGKRKQSAAISREIVGDQKCRMSFDIMELEVLVEEINTLSVQQRDKKNR